MALMPQTKAPTADATSIERYGALYAAFTSAGIHPSDAETYARKIVQHGKATVRFIDEDGVVTLVEYTSAL